MSVEILTLLFFGSLLGFLLLGVPLAFVLGGVSVIFLYFTMGPVSFYIVASKFWESMTSFTLVAIPMYVFMAMILEKSGVAHALYRMMHLWFGALRGGLAIGTVAICAIFAAMSGISGAAVVTMGTIALPRMLERGYDTRLSLGAINAGGGWGILIPPSIPMVLYAMISEVSVGRLFASGIGPGILLFVLVTIYIGVRAWLQPSIAPALPPEERGTWREKLLALRAVLLPILIVVMVLGSIFGGLATPTEAAAIGVLGALIAAALNRQLNLPVVRHAAMQTLRLTTLIMWILFAAHAFSTAYTLLGAHDFIQGLMAQIPGGKWGALAFMLFVLFAARHGARPGGHHADHAAGVPAGGGGRGLRSDLVRRALHHHDGDRLHDAAVRLQPVLHQGRGAARGHDGRDLQLGDALRACHAGRHSADHRVPEHCAVFSESVLRQGLSSSPTVPDARPGRESALMEPDANSAQNSATAAPELPTLRAALLLWFKLGCLSFGGPAGQIALMHRWLVEERRWISEARFLHALNYCMLLPGPEAQQLATYLGWLLHRTWGGIVAARLFVLPSLVLLIGLSWVYMAYGHQPVVAGLFYGIKPAVTAIVAQAALRIGSRTLRNNGLRCIAVAAFAAIFLFAVPFPAIVLAAAWSVGWAGGSRPDFFRRCGAGVVKAADARRIHRPRSMTTRRRRPTHGSVGSGCCAWAPSVRCCGRCRCGC